VGSRLTGRYRVRVSRPALNEARRLFPRVSDRMEVRRQALKLRFWPDSAPSTGTGQVLDLDWEWVKGLPFGDVGELRVHGTIAGNDNLRIIFHDGGGKLKDPLPNIWILRVFQKKRDDFSSNDLAVFKQRRRDVRRIFYGE